MGRAGVSCSFCSARGLRPAAPSGPQSSRCPWLPPQPLWSAQGAVHSGVVCWGQGKCVGVSEGQIPQPPSTLCPPPWPLLGLRFGWYLFATLTSLNSPSAESGRACAAARGHWYSADGWPASPGDTGYHHHPPSTPPAPGPQGPSVSRALVGSLGHPKVLRGGRGGSRGEAWDACEAPKRGCWGQWCEGGLGTCGSHIPGG